MKKDLKKQIVSALRDLDWHLGQDMLVAEDDQDKDSIKELLERIAENSKLIKAVKAIKE